MKTYLILFSLGLVACGDADQPAPEPTIDEQVRRLNEAHEGPCHLCDGPSRACVPCYWENFNGEVLCLVQPVGTDREALCSF